MRASYEYDEESEDDLRREEGISFPPDPGPLGASGRSISLDPGALAGNTFINEVIKITKNQIILIFHSKLKRFR